MSNRSVAAILIFAVMVLMPLQAGAATPQETVQVQVDKVLKTLGDPQFKSESKDAKIAKIREIVNQVFDYEELSKRTLGRNWKKLNDAQQKEFVQLFSELLEKVYADRLLAYSDEKVVFDKETMLKEGQAEVQSFVMTSDGRKIPIFYRLLQKDSQWHVYDVIIEGVSMVQNYRTQFKDILEGGSPEKVLEVLREKVKAGNTAS